MSWIDRYLAAVLRSIPESKRADVERELRSSIEDGIEERVGAGESRDAAERAVLEGLGNPADLAVAYTGRPNYLLSPELFPLWRTFLTRVLIVAVPASAVIIGGLEAIGSGSGVGVVGAAISGALNVAIQTTFWMTAFFVFLDWAEPARQARAEILAASGKWTLERLPKASTGRIPLAEAAGEIVTVVISIAVLIFAATLTTTSALGVHVPLLSTTFTAIWLPVLILSLAVRGVVHLRAYNTGRWTTWLTIYYTILQLAFGALLFTLAETGSILDPGFGNTIGLTNLADGQGPVMQAVAVGTVLVTIFEIGRIILRARRDGGTAAQLKTSAQST